MGTIKTDRKLLKDVLSLVDDDYSHATDEEKEIIDRLRAEVMTTNALVFDYAKQKVENLTLGGLLRWISELHSDSANTGWWEQLDIDTHQELMVLAKISDEVNGRPAIGDDGTRSHDPLCPSRIGGECLEGCAGHIKVCPKCGGQLVVADPSDGNPEVTYCEDNPDHYRSDVEE